MENQPSAKATENRSLSGREANELRNKYKETGLPLPEGVLGIGAQRLGPSSEWALTVYAEPGVDASEFIDEHFAGVLVIVEEPGAAEAYPDNA